METTDLHVHVYPYDYYSDKPVDTVGLARTASLIEAVRDEAANSMLIDNGDFLQGNPMGDYIAYERGMKEGDMHPIITAMNTLGFEASTLGNHEFNYGLDFLMKSISGAQFPVVSANVVLERGTAPRADKTLVRPWTIIEKNLLDGVGQSHRIRIGLIGFVPPQIMNWDRRHLDGRLSTRDIVKSAAAHVPALREAGADIVIALSHSGIADDQNEGGENASLQLAAIEGIDAILSGHQHLVFPGERFTGIEGVDAKTGTLHGKPAVMAGCWGSHLGLLDLLLEHDGSRWRIAAHTAQARPIVRRDNGPGITPLVDSQQAVLESVADIHKQTLEYIRRPVGHTTAPLYSYFSLVADDPSVQIVSAAQSWYTRKMLKGTCLEGLPILSAASPFKAGGRGGPEYYTDVPAGPIAIRNVADLYLYPNTVRAVKVTGAQIRDWLERAVSLFNRVFPGEKDRILLDPEFPCYNFDVIDGITYGVDISEPARFTHDGILQDAQANRIRELMYKGQTLKPDQEFIVATNNYRASGGGNFPGSDGTTIVFEAPDTNREVVVRYIIEQGPIDPKVHETWHFTHLPDTTVLFDTGPGAAKYLSQLKGLDIEPAGDGPDGFARYRIKL